MTTKGQNGKNGKAPADRFDERAAPLLREYTRKLRKFAARFEKLSDRTTEKQQGEFES